jgi:hypothetical protein
MAKGYREIIQINVADPSFSITSRDISKVLHDLKKHHTELALATAIDTSVTYDNAIYHLSNSITTGSQAAQSALSRLPPDYATVAKCGKGLKKLSDLSDPSVIVLPALSALQEKVKSHVSGLYTSAETKFKEGLQQTIPSECTAIFQQVNVLMEQLHTAEAELNSEKAAANHTSTFGEAFAQANEGLLEKYLKQTTTERKLSVLTKVQAADLKLPSSLEIISNGLLELYAIPSDVSSVSVKAHAQQCMTAIFAECENLGKRSQKKFDYGLLGKALYESRDGARGGEIVDEFPQF